MISGTVVSEKGEKISGAKIKATWMEEKRSLLGSGGYPYSKEVLSAADGSFILEVPKMPHFLQASKGGYLDKSIEPKAGHALRDLKIILEDSEKIRVYIQGIRKEELQFLRVRAIASGKQYVAAPLYRVLYMGAEPTGKSLVAPKNTLIFFAADIKGVPPGPAEIHVSLIEEDLPAQTVEAKRGALVTVFFKFESERFILNGKVTQLGNPLSDWILFFKPAGFPSARPIGIVQTNPKGWYQFRLRPGTYEIKLAGPSIREVKGVKTKVWKGMFTTTYTVKGGVELEVLDLEVSTLKKIDSKKGKR